ncbi:hypothetical protein, conserved [Trypanosoma brucei gambiense DAL972]|uniref:Doublecortin domain-containing protein n=1 Tax=Trypanosoma brucei gambiense (strain MHOM/CI/86/DAL972) TaxID=679716 RepID=D0A711_TRYB9|nr:hypothetical protein, conserved [Trypanosoma brucei gambiense DAL972]CBH17462.1 hypothetical protein, conserved [Trypanosoma brucei gambiense DAL972]|eukprot:XP_011779726.1 hypothetical protein, conserved [Trypanosoma brucei gambiense DAL972]
MVELTVYEGHDVFLQNAVRLHIPCKVYTIEGLLSLVGRAVASSPGGPSAARRYRFVYSLDGSPLRSVDECLEVGTVIVSCTPGFQKRKHHVESPSNPVLDLLNRKGYETYSAAESRGLSATPPSHDGFVPISFQQHSVPRASPKYVFCDSNPGPIPNFSSIGGASVEWGGVSCRIGDERIVLPPTPSFDVPFPDMNLDILHAERVAAVKTLITLKLCGRSFLNDELLFEKELEEVFRPIIAEQASCPSWRDHTLDRPPPHVVVDGPPKSGVSTSLAYYSSMLVSSAASRYATFLILPLNFELLFDGSLGISSYSANRHLRGSKSANYNDARTQSLLLDVPFFYMTVVRALIDSVVAQRPSVRNCSTALVEMWEQLVKTTAGSGVRLNTCEVAHAVGHSALYRWETFAAPASQILRAAKLNPRDMKLRDAVLELVLVELVAQVASALHFSGVVYVVDGLRPLARSLCDRLRRPGGDAAVFLDRVAQRSWVHLAVGVDSLSTQVLESALLTRVRRVKLLRMLSVEYVTKMYGFPKAIHCGSNKYPLEMFLGTPGYLRMVHDLLRSCEGRKAHKGDSDGYAVRIEDLDVSNALLEFEAVRKLGQDTQKEMWSLS